MNAQGHFIFRFGAVGDKPLGGGNHPPRNTRVKKSVEKSEI